MRKLFICALVLFFSSNLSAEINQVLDNFLKKIPNSARSWNLRNIDGVFEFDKLPEPLKYSIVSYTLKILNIPPNHENMDWTIKLTNSNKHYKVISDSNLVWRAPHKLGDTYKGTFKIKPLTSGRKNLKLWVPEIRDDFFINWNIDENGKLLALDKQRTNINKFEIFEVVFFENDSVIFSDYNDINGALKHEVIITPVPNIGEESEVIINNNVDYFYNDGIDIELITKNIKISKLTGSIDHAVYPGQKMQIKFKIIPDSVNYNHQIVWHNYYIENNKKVHSSLLTLFFCMIFNEDGSLKYLSNRACYSDKLKKYYLKNFKEPVLSSKKIILTKDGKIIESF